MSPASDLSLWRALRARTCGRRTRCLALHDGRADLRGVRAPTIEELKAAFLWRCGWRVLHAARRLWCVVLKAADLSNASLRDVLWVSCRVHSCLFNRADLREMAVLWGEFKQCEFVDSDLSGATLGFDTQWPTRYLQCRFVRCRLRGLSVARADFQDCEFEDCDFTGVRFRFAQFAGCRFAGDLSDLMIGELGRAPRVKASLIDCDLSEVNANELQLRGVHFERVRWPASTTHWLPSRVELRRAIQWGEHSDRFARFRPAVAVLGVTLRDLDESQDLAILERQAFKRLVELQDADINALIEAATA